MVTKFEMQNLLFLWIDHRSGQCFLWSLLIPSPIIRDITIYIYIYVPNYKHQTCSSPSPVQNIIHGAEIKKGKLNNDRLQSSQPEHKPFIWVILVILKIFFQSRGSPARFWRCLDILSECRRIVYVSENTWYWEHKTMDKKVR